MIGYGYSYFVSTILDTESGTAPVNTVAPAITGTAQEGQTVSCSTGTWTGTPTITYAYQWKRNGSNIGSATNSTYTLVTADVGQSIKCTVTATNFVGSANADSNTVIPVSAFSFLLDTYSSAAAAYSVRKLRSAYTGYAMIVRRTVSATTVACGVSFDVNNAVSLDSPITITFGSSSSTNLGEFVKASGYANPDSLVSAVSAFVNTWYDQSGNTNDFTQSTAANQPRIINNGVLELNSLKATVNSNVGSLIGLTATGAVGKTIFTVAEVDTQTTVNYLLSSSVGGLFYNGSLAGVNGLGGFDGTNARSLTGEDLNRHLGYFNLKSSKLFAAKDGASESDLGSFGVASFTFNGMFQRGGLSFLDFLGNAQEIVVYNSDQTSNKSGIETNINNYYGIY